MIYVLALLIVTGLVKLIVGKQRTRVITIDIETPPLTQYEPFAFELDKASGRPEVYAVPVRVTVTDASSDADVHSVCYTREDAKRDREARKRG